MTSTQFAVALVHQFGDWPGDGMKLTVAEYLKDLSDPDLRRLYRGILTGYAPKRPGPPVLAEILTLWRDLPAAPPRAALPEPALSDAEREEMAAKLENLLHKLAEKKRP